jgi:tRNA (cytidine/uridine-2'-O-)-methyltransferase
VDIRRHDSVAAFESTFADGRTFCLSARATRPYTAVVFQDGDCLLFGKESSGLPREVVERHADGLFHIPMPSGKVRSLNLATAVGIVLYEALRQIEKW